MFEVIFHSPMFLKAAYALSMVSAVALAMTLLMVAIGGKSNGTD